MKLIFCSLLLIASQALAQTVVPAGDDPVNSPKEPLRKKIFGENLDTAGCQLVETKPDGSIPIDAELEGFLKLIIKNLESKDPKHLLPLFHKRMDVGLPVVHQLVTDLHNVYRQPFDVSIFRLWALNTVDGATKALPCDGDRLHLYPLYGYPLQFGVWLQIMGQKELGRIYISLVPADGRWNIGSLNAQQWTHEGKDFATWAEEATKLSRMGHKVAAWAKFDIAAKLLDGGGFVDIAMRDEVIAARDREMSQDAWEKELRDVLKDWDVGYVSSMIVEGGAGLLVRVKIPKEISANDVLSDCRKLVQRVHKEAWASHLAGVRCSYIIGKEDPNKEGKLGGVFWSFASLKEK